MGDLAPVARGEEGALLALLPALEDAAWPLVVRTGAARAISRLASRSLTSQLVECCSEHRSGQGRVPGTLLPQPNLGLAVYVSS